MLLTHEAWVRLRGDMATAGFPTVEQLGLYKFEAQQTPIWIYQVRWEVGSLMILLSYSH